MLLVIETSLSRLSHLTSLISSSLTQQDFCGPTMSFSQTSIQFPQYLDLLHTGVSCQKLDKSELNALIIRLSWSLTANPHRVAVHLQIRSFVRIFINEIVSESFSHRNQQRSSMAIIYSFKSRHRGSHIEASIPFILYSGRHNVSGGAKTLTNDCTGQQDSHGATHFWMSLLMTT